jgi:hypothetical protein
MLVFDRTNDPSNCRLCSVFLHLLKRRRRCLAQLLKSSNFNPWPFTLGLGAEGFSEWFGFDDMGSLYKNRYETRRLGISEGRTLRVWGFAASSSRAIGSLFLFSNTE